MTKDLEGRICESCRNCKGQEAGGPKMRTVKKHILRTRRAVRASTFSRAREYQPAAPCSNSTVRCGGVGEATDESLHGHMKHMKQSPRRNPKKRSTNLAFCLPELSASPRLYNAKGRGRRLRGGSQPKCRNVPLPWVNCEDASTKRDKFADSSAAQERREYPFEWHLSLEHSMQGFPL